MKYEIIKGSEKDFEGAPEWATIVVSGKINGRIFYLEGAKKGLKYKACDVPGIYSINDIHTESTVIAERRPITEPVWDGEGLPPVGVECEVKTSARHPYEWERCKIVFSDENSGVAFVYVINRSLDCVGSSRPDFFRPIRSPEDVARDESIEAMRDVGYTLPAAIRFTKEEMAALYDAGYRKLEGK